MRQFILKSVIKVHNIVWYRSMNYDKDNNVGFSMKIKNLEYSLKGLGSISQAVQKIIKK